MQPKKTPMLTRVSDAQIESLKLLSINPEHGNLRIMCEHLLERFITEKPYKNRAFLWLQPAPKNTPHWKAYNVVVSDELSKRVKGESARIDVSLTNLLYTALSWWMDQHRKTQDPTD